MHSKSFAPVLLWLLLTTVVTAQDKNPFESIGKKGKILTLTQGRYEELFDQDSIQQIGTALVNIRQMKVVKLLKDEKEAQRLLDNSINSRFLSVDPITNVYPMLTPYQYASNRPIDGIDLDGKEWTKVETYDPKSGITNVQFQVKLKVTNESNVFTDVQNLKSEVQKQFAVAFNEVKNKQSNVSYSASIDVEFVDKIEAHSFSVMILDGQEPKPGFIGIAGLTGSTNTKENVFSVTGSKFINGKQVIKNAKDVAQDIVHELIHTGGVLHPQDSENTAQDVDLNPTLKNGKFDTYILSKEANLALIITNIMIYGDVKINGKKVKEYQPDKFQRNKVSPNQAQIVSEQIQKDESKSKSN